MNTHGYGIWGYPQPRWPDYAERLAQLARYDILIASTSNLASLVDYRGADQVTAGMAVLRAQNPSQRVYRYYSAQSKNTWDKDDVPLMQSPLRRQVIVDKGWWLYNADGGIMRDTDASGKQLAPMIDVGRPGLREAFAQGIIDDWLYGYDGVCLDILNPPVDLVRVGTAAQRRYLNYADSADWWERAWKPFIEYVTTELHAAGIQVIGNYAGAYGIERYPYGKDRHQRALLDGTVHEFCWFKGNGDWLSAVEVMDVFASVRTDPLMVLETDTLRGHEDRGMMAAAMYLISLPGSRRLRSKRFTHWTSQSRPSWDPTWDIDLGEPVGVPDGLRMTVFRRYFERGVVIANYSDEAWSTYMRGYWMQGDEPVHGRYTLPARSAVILARCEG